MRRHLVLFVQPEMSRHFDFMKLYDEGLITDWVRDPSHARTQLTSFVDVVVLDLNHGPDECLAFCTEAKRQRQDRVVVLLRANAVQVPSADCFDLVLPAKVGQEDFVREVKMLLSRRHHRAAS